MKTSVDQIVSDCKCAVQRFFSCKDMQYLYSLTKCMNCIIFRFVMTFLLVAYASQC